MFIAIFDHFDCLEESAENCSVFYGETLRDAAINALASRGLATDNIPATFPVYRGSTFLSAEAGKQFWFTLIEAYLGTGFAWGAGETEAQAVDRVFTSGSELR